MCGFYFVSRAWETWPKLGWHGWQKKKKKELEYTRMTYFKKKLNWKKQ